MPYYRNPTQRNPFRENAKITTEKGMRITWKAPMPQSYQTLSLKLYRRFEQDVDAARKLPTRYCAERYTVAVEVHYECGCQGNLCIGYVFVTVIVHPPVPSPRSPKPGSSKPSFACTTTSSTKAATSCPTSSPTSSPSVNGNFSGAWTSLN